MASAIAPVVEFARRWNPPARFEFQDSAGKAWGTEENQIGWPTSMRLPSGFLEHKSPQPVFLVLNAFDDAQPLALADGVERIDVVHHHMRDVE
jgi:hypothetical protein